jgi:hypothetical protein
MKNWFLNIEDKLINFLTAICWWLDLHFNIKSRWIADASSVCVYITYGQMTSSADGMMFTNIILSFILLGINNISTLGRIVYKNSSLSPNQNREEFIKFIIFGFFMFALIPALTLNSLYPLSMPVSLLVWYYILCTEPMPPAEKVKRKERNEMRKMKLSESS